MTNSSITSPAQHHPTASATCIYCRAEDTDSNPLCHGPVYDDPHSDTPTVDDYAYCEDCSNRGGWNTNDPHRFFAYCTQCEREFWDDREYHVLRDDDPNNPFGETACLRCIRTRRIELRARCRLCGHPADGYYCSGFCRSCECGCIANAVDSLMREPPPPTHTNPPPAHTPAPWTIRTDPADNDRMVLTGANGRIIAWLANTQPDEWDDMTAEQEYARQREEAANDHLLESAPELLSVAERYLALCHSRIEAESEYLNDSWSEEAEESLRSMEAEAARVESLIGRIRG